MRCGFCARELPDEPEQEKASCGSCGGGCRKVHCPDCGFANPLIPAYLKRLATKKQEKKD